jgi:hypothetical protein
MTPMMRRTMIRAWRRKWPDMPACLAAFIAISVCPTPKLTRGPQIQTHACQKTSAVARRLQRRVRGPAHAAKQVEHTRRCTNAFDAESPQRCVAMRSNAVGRLRACHAVISLATLASFGWVASMARSYSVKRCTV